MICDCPECDGNGEIVCPSCRGDGTVKIALDRADNHLLSGMRLEDREALQPFIKDIRRLRSQAERLAELMPHKRQLIDEQLRTCLRQVDQQAEQALKEIEVAP